MRVVRYHFRVQEVVAKVGYCKNNRNSYFNIVMQYELSDNRFSQDRGISELGGQRGFGGVIVCVDGAAILSVVTSSRHDGFAWPIIIINGVLLLFYERFMSLRETFYAEGQKGRKGQAVAAKRGA